MIPKKIHYCWFGHGEKPKLAKKCIASWKKYCPDYEIIEWNEDNFDVNMNPYTQMCYEQKKYAFLSDYVRLLVVYEHGGIYFDTDVEVVQNIDFLLSDEAFIGCEIDGTDEKNGIVNTGQGFGSTTKSLAVKAMLEEYNMLLDIYFAGSDQIWNTLFQNGRDPAFYLEFVPPNAIKASYAASFATEDIIEEYKPQIKKWLSDMDYISVREKNGISIINNLGVNNVIQVLDPVFLLKKDRWIEMEAKLEIGEPYILLYDFDCNEEIGEYTRKIAKKNGWKVYSILKNPYCDRDFEQEGPTEFLWLIDHSEFVISNSFHATAFSIIFEKQFEVFERKEDINTRIRDLVKSLDLENRILNEKKNQQTQSELIEYKIVKTLLEKNIVESQNYIKDVCNSKKE